MSMMKQAVKSGGKPAAPKGIIYGCPGIGKTTFAASDPGAFILDCENGSNCLRNPVTGEVMERDKTPYLDRWDTMRDWLDAITNEDHGKTVLVIDSIDWMIRRIEESVSGADAGQLNKTLGQSHGGYGNGKQVLKNFIFRDLLPRLDRIQQRGIAVILLAHAHHNEVMDAEGMTVDKVCPDLAQDFLSVIVEWSDFVCLANKSGEAPQDHYLQTVETPRAVAKNRYGMPERVAMDWASFVGEIKNTFANGGTKKEGK